MKFNELQEFINFELKSLDIIYKDIIDFPNLKCDEHINNYDKSAIALMLSQFYNGMENIFKRFLLYENIKINKNENYHIEIINTFNKTIFDKYSFAFGNEILNTITILRRFRHYVFHGYSFNLEWDRLKLAIENINSIYPKFKEEIFKLNNIIEENL